MTQPYKLKPVVEEAYDGVHTWLRKRSDADRYMDIGPVSLDCPGMRHVAAQFARYFHAHHFKTRYILEEMLTRQQLESWTNHNPRIALIDVGCGAGAASAALTANLIELRASEQITEDLTLACIGVDPVANALGLYNQMMQGLKRIAQEYGIRLEFKIIDRPVSEAVTDLVLHLEGFLSEWDQPALSQVIIAQSNIVRPLGSLHQEANSRRTRLRKELEIPNDLLLEEGRFGARETRSYLQLFRQLPTDNLHILTVGTCAEEWKQRVLEMGESISEVFKNHSIEVRGPCFPCVIYKNPKRSYWRATKNKKRSNPRNFIAVAHQVTNTEQAGDTDWHRVIAVENLELAWSRARALLQREVLYDEIEIRLFERNLDGNLERLRQELLSYDRNVARTGERMHFRFVKNEQDEKGRPRVLSRIEEEIVSIAIVQELGAAAFALNSASYAYRPNPRFASRSEFLYEYWFSAYQRYKEESRNAVAKHTDCKVLTIDIKSYFTEIPQQRLVESVQREIRTQSARVEWLLHRLLCVNLNDHSQNHGLSQGGAGSGFYANAYLTKFDSKFGINNQWEAHLYRFVDDIVIVIPKPNNPNDVNNAANETLKDLGLEVNEDKSELFNQDEYLNLPDDKGLMNDLSKKFDELTKPLWRTNSLVKAVREQLRQRDDWWKTVGAYRDHLHSICHYIEPHRLSRKLHQYVENYALEQNEGENDSSFVVPPIGAQNWADEFRKANDKWIKDRESLRAELIKLAKDSFRKLCAVPCEKQKRLLSTRIYFSANRLARLGYGDAVGFIINILLHQPWIIRQPQYVIRGLAIQGFSSHLEKLFNHYEELDNSWSSSFLAVIIRAIRHLSEVPESLEDGIIQIALDGDSDHMLRLLATETWLMKLDCSHVGEYECKIRQFINKEQYARVRKNYLLLLGKYLEGSIEERKYDDPILTRALEVAIGGELDELFADAEPDILRERYYSTYYPSNIDFDDEVPY